MRYLNLFVVLMLVLATACKHKEEPDANLTKRNPVDTAKIAEIKKDTSKAVTVDDNANANDSTTASQSKPQVVLNSTATNDVKVKNDHRYYLIVGSFKDLENSKKLSKKLEGSEILDGQNSFQRVAEAAFDDRKEAVKALKQYRRKHSKNAAWLLHQ